MFAELIEEQVQAKPTLSKMTYDEARPIIQEIIKEKCLDIQTDPAIDLRETGIRFRDLVNCRFVEDKSVVIIGAGNLGHPTLRTVLNLGFKTVGIIDNDVIDIENISPQDHDIIELGQPKVKALEQWALRHCGVQITAVQERVSSWQDILSMLDFRPDIVIVAVDNMILRNALLESILYAENNTDVELFIDMRMSAGQWATFILPMKAVHTQMDISLISPLVRKYMIFPDEEGEQEPCTARATNFTGVNAASYVGSFLAWYSNNPMTFELLRSFLDVTDTGSAFKWEKSFNSMKWQEITKSPQAFRMQQNLIQQNKAVAQAEVDKQEAAAILEMVIASTKAGKTLDPETCTAEGISVGDILIYEADYAFSPYRAIRIYKKDFNGDDELCYLCLDVFNPEHTIYIYALDFMKVVLKDVPMSTKEMEHSVYANQEGSDWLLTTATCAIDEGTSSGDLPNTFIRYMGEARDDIHAQLLSVPLQEYPAIPTPAGTGLIDLNAPIQAYEDSTFRHMTTPTVITYTLNVNGNRYDVYPCDPGSRWEGERSYSYAVIGDAKYLITEVIDQNKVFIRNPINDSNIMLFTRNIDAILTSNSLLET